MTSLNYYSTMNETRNSWSIPLNELKDLTKYKLGQVKSRKRETLLKWVKERHEKMILQSLLDRVRRRTCPQANREISSTSANESSVSYFTTFVYRGTSVSFDQKTIRELYDPESGYFTEISHPFYEDDDDPKSTAEQESFSDWCYETSLELWDEYLIKEVNKMLTKLMELSRAGLDNKGYYAYALKRRDSIFYRYRTNGNEFIHYMKDLLDELPTLVNRLKIKIRTEIKCLRNESQFRFFSRSIITSPRNAARAHRAPMKSAAKSGGGDGDSGDSDGDSDQGDPPGPSFVVPSLQTSQLNPILYSSAFSRIVHPCSCCMGGRWSV